jgi:nucleoside-diphosphate-sugar epimerase
MMGFGQRLFVFGLGYSALVLARRLLARGWRVSGTVRGADKAASLAAEGIATHLLDRDRPLENAARAMLAVSHVLSSVPPDARGDCVLDQHEADLAALKGVRWVGYLSTTSVYGDRDGAWVDEESGLHPTGARGRARVDAEQRWLRLTRFGLPVHVFRLAGIYGPGRSALDQLRAGTAKRVVKPGQVFSRVHVQDIAQTLERSMAKPNAGRIYNVCDDEPAPPQDVIAYGAALLGLPAPPEQDFATASTSLSAMARGFYDDNKRVSNRRIKDELGVKLAYPNYRLGLGALSR